MQREAVEKGNAAVVQQVDPVADTADIAQGPQAEKLDNDGRLAVKQQQEQSCEAGGQRGESKHDIASCVDVPTAPEPPIDATAPIARAP